ncbi:MAG: hypothetical protein EXR05_05710 [Acetobacteraceae bacterium]|nr:hypothetical protein [Acetobacteraceae bacterium]MSP29524.1 hypothetical protein [Acetobacteraceae bacterium]
MTNGKTHIFAGAAAAISPKGSALRGGLFRCQAGDGAWESLTAGLPPEVEVRAILVHPTNPDLIFVGTQDGPYRSRDGGDHWERLDFPDQDAVIWAISIHPTRPNIMYVGTAPIAIYRSLDGGDSWVRLPRAVSPAHCERVGFDSRVLRITINPSRPDDIYAALEVSGVIRSADGGETWSDMSAPLIKLAELPHLQSSVGGRHCGHCEGMLDSHATAISPVAPETVFLGIRMGLFRSDDRGAHWYDAEIGRFSPLTYCHDVIVSPHDARVLYACLSPAAFSEDGSLYRSDDLATTWRRIDHGIKAQSTLMAVSLHPSDPAKIYCVTRLGQVFGTEDAGGSWQEYRLPEGVEDVYAIACA